MKRRVMWTALAVLFLLWLLVACTSFVSAPMPTLAEIPTPVTTPTRSNTPMPSAPTQVSTMVQPSPTIKPTTAATVSASPAASTPKVISFTVVPTTTHRLGDKYSVTWQAQGTRARLCPTVYGYGGQPEEQELACSDVPLAGTKSITVDDKSLIWSGLQLRVTTGETSDRSWVNIRVGCQGFRDWFFSNPPVVCPQAAVAHSAGAAQHFEHGLMIWVKEPDSFYIFYETNQQPPRVLEQLSAPYRFKPGASPNNRVGETPPRGLQEPVSGFGQLWRGEFEGLQNVRQRLGWATEQEFSFNASQQCEVALFPKLWTCYLGAPDGKVLVYGPDSTAGVHLIWNVR